MEQDREIVAIQKEAGDIVSRAENFQVVSNENFSKATEIISWISGVRKKIEAKRKSYVQPLNDHIKTINEEFKGYLKPLDEADVIIRGKMLSFRQKQEEERQKEEERIRQEAEELAKKVSSSKTEKKQMVEEIVSSSAPVELEKTVGTATIKKVWTFEIIDENKIPREFLATDERKIREAIREGKREIQGIRIFQQDQISTR